MPADLLQIPLRDQSSYNELSHPEGAPRPHWAQFVEQLQAISPDEMSKRWARAERRIHENGITYNMYGDPEGVGRPWRLDLLRP